MDFRLLNPNMQNKSSLGRGAKLYSLIEINKKLIMK